MVASYGRRLFAACSLFVLLPALIYGQDSTATRLETAPNAGSRTASRTAESVQNAVIQLSPPQYPPAHGTALSAQIVPAAGIIFAGHVTSVWRAQSPLGITSASTTITFHVDQGIRGASTGQLLTIREWAGLWDRGERYRVGESVFLFLYPPSRLGLTSPVSGASGRFAVDAQRRVVVNAKNAATFAAPPAFGARTVVPYAEFERTVLRNVVEK